MSDERKPDTVGDLMRLLLAYPLDMPLLVQGYEMGLDWWRVEVEQAQLREYDAGVCGAFDDSPTTGDVGVFSAVVIRRHGAPLDNAAK